MLAVVLADTHMREGSKRRLPDEVLRALESADVVLHAGDVLDRSVLGELAAFAPVQAVLGNNDVELVGVLPETRYADIDGVRVAMIHDSGGRKGRERRLYKRFPDADVVVFGHSHIPWNAIGVRGQLLFNPGSATERRRQPQRSFGILEARAGELARHEIVAIPG